MPRKKTKITMDTVRDLCEEKNWSTLETEYINANHSMRWQCNVCAFEWSSNYNNTRKKKGCSRCIKGSYKYTIEEVQRVAGKKGFILLETEYNRSDVPMRWKCSTCSYEWSTSFANINREKRRRCPLCNNGRSQYTFEEVKEIAASKKLECLEREYKHGNIQMTWRCLKCDRKWAAPFRSIVQNIGCIKCTFKETIHLGLEHVHEVIKNRNMTCLDTEYLNNNTHMSFRCTICDNIWKAKFHHIKDSHSGCPHCACWKSERLCRELFQSFMGYHFPKKRPKFLQGLEYDGYCKKIGLAFEYQGAQHYSYVPYFHKTEQDFKDQQESDQQKRELSEQHEVTLIEVPCKYDFRDKEKMENFILQKLIEHGFIFLIQPSI